MPTRTSTLTRDVRDAGAFCQVVPWVGFVDAVFFTKTGSFWRSPDPRRGRLRGVSTPPNAKPSPPGSRRPAPLGRAHTPLPKSCSSVPPIWLMRPASASGVDAILRRRPGSSAPRRAVVHRLAVSRRRGRRQASHHGVDGLARRLARAPLSPPYATPCPRRAPWSIWTRTSRNARRTCGQGRGLRPATRGTRSLARVLAQAERSAVSTPPQLHRPRRPVASCCPDARLDFDAADSALECHRTRLDDHYVRVLTLKEPPGADHALLFPALYEVPSPMLIVGEWQQEGQGRSAARFMRSVVLPQRPV